LRLRSLALLIVFMLAASAQAAGRRVVFVDNRVPPGGAGSNRQPFASLAEAMRFANDFDVVFVAETDQPYVDSITLRRGQMLVGSAFGLDAIRTEFKTELEAPPMPAATGPGPSIQGSVILAGDNVVAGVTLTTVAPAAISASSPSGPISVLNTYIRTSVTAMGVSLANADFPVTFTGGGITSSGGGGVMMYGGKGDAVFDRFSIEGTFGSSPLDLRARAGKTIFRGKAAIDVTDTSQPAVGINLCSGGVEIGIPLRITSRARGVSIVQSTAKIDGAGSRISAANGPALEIRDSNVEAAFADVSAGGGDHGILVDKLRGKLMISGGKIQGARLRGIEITQSSGVRLENITLTDAGTGERAKCDGSSDAKTGLRCGAAIHLRHLSRSAFENITVTGGKQLGLNANNIEDVTFANLQIRGIGDEQGEAAVVLDETKGTVTFSRCAFENAMGGSLLVSQQFNSGKLVFDRCTFGAAAQPTGASYLASFRTSGPGKLEVEMNGVELRDNAASAIRAEARGTSSINLKVADSRIERLGRSAIDVAARDQARVAFMLRGTVIHTPGNLDLPAVDVAAAAGATACADLVGNQIVVGGSVPPVKLASSVGACR
jgi:Right handed beta helix region